MLLSHKYDAIFLAKLKPCDIVYCSAVTFPPRCSQTSYLPTTWLATGSTAQQEACNYSWLQRCQSVKEGIHAFILANPIHSSPLLVPPHLSTSHPSCPSSSFPTSSQACLDERLSRETSANGVWFGPHWYWHRVQRYPPPLHLNLVAVDVGKDEGGVGLMSPNREALVLGIQTVCCPHLIPASSSWSRNKTQRGGARGHV